MWEDRTAVFDHGMLAVRLTEKYKWYESDTLINSCRSVLLPVLTGTAFVYYSPHDIQVFCS